MSTIDNIVKTNRSDKEIKALEEWCYSVTDHNNSHYANMSYEHGIVAVLDWLTGYDDDNPNGEGII